MKRRRVGAAKAGGSRRGAVLALRARWLVALSASFSGRPIPVVGPLSARCYWRARGPSSAPWSASSGEVWRFRPRVENRQGRFLGTTPGHGGKSCHRRRDGRSHDRGVAREQRLRRDLPTRGDRMVFKGLSLPFDGCLRPGPAERQVRDSGHQYTSKTGNDPRLLCLPRRRLHRRVATHSAAYGARPTCCRGSTPAAASASPQLPKCSLAAASSRRAS